jgi:hypothetical protein
MASRPDFDSGADTDYQRDGIEDSPFIYLAVAADVTSTLWSVRFGGGHRMDRNEPNFDWVTARTECSASKAYREFVLQIKRDVEIRNGSLSSKERRHEVNFVFSGESEPTSIVVRAQKGGNYLAETPLAKAIFTKIPEGIAVEYGGTKIEGLLTLSQDGECRLKVDGVEYSFWQFRKLALEPIFFDAVKEYRE